MAWTQSDIDALKAAIAQGVKSVEFRSGEVSRRVEYPSLSQMREALAAMEAEVNPQISRFDRRRTVAGYDSGL